MSDQTTNLSLPFIQAAQAQKHVTHNEALLTLDALVQCVAVSASTSSQPGSPADGSLYILPPGKTGADWGGMSNYALAYYVDGAWSQITPREGWLAYVKSTHTLAYYTGSAWAALSGAISARLNDIAGATYAQGNILYYNGSALTVLAPGASGQFLKTNGAGANPAWATPSGGGGALSDGDYGDIVVSSSGTALSIDANVVGNSQLRQSAGLSVVGRGANSTGNVADITAATDGHALRLSGATLGFGTLAAGAFGANVIAYSKLQQVSATSRFLGRITTGAGDIEELTAANAKTILALAQADISGLATSDSPQFAAINLGHASDTTLTRTGTGVIAVEGVEVTTNSATQTLTNKTLTSPTISGGTHTAITSLGVRSTGAAYDLTLACAEALTAGRTLTLKLNDAARTIDIAGGLTLAAAFSTSGANALTLTTTGSTNVTLPTTGTLATLAGAETLTNKTLTSPTINAASLSGTLSGAVTLSGLITFSAGADMTPATTPSTTAAGYLGLPQNSQSSAYTFVMSDAGKHIFHPASDTTARTWTIPANASVAFPIGTAITLVNDAGAGAITLAITSDTLRRSDGTAGTGSRTIAASATATIVKTKSTEWHILGAFS